MDLNPSLVGVLGIILLMILLALKMPVAFAMALVGLLGFSLLAGRDAGLSIAGIVPYTTALSQVLTGIPMFILMGELCNFAGLSRDLYAFAYKWIGHLPGGLAQATIIACTLFSAVTGSSVACAATIGTVAIPEMKRHGYSMRLATGTVAAGGTLGILIPPSTSFMIYGLLTEQSIGKLFIAGIIPGVLVASFYGVLIYIRCKLNPALGPAAPAVSWKERFISLRSIWAVFLLFAIVIGGLYIGIFTATEAAAVGAFGSFVLLALRKQLKWRNLNDSLTSTAKITSMVLTIIIGAYIFGYFLAITKLPMTLSEFVMGLGLSKYLVLAIIIAMYFVLGCFLDALAMMVLTLPVVFPLIVAMGFNPIWFGVILVRMIEIGLMTPPFALNVYVIHGVAKDVPMGEIFRGIGPFVVSDIINVGLLVFIPQLSLFLPNRMSGT